MYDIVTNNYNIDVLLDNCDQKLFTSSLYIAHCLHHIIISRKRWSHACNDFETRGHNYSLPRFKFLNARNSFINRSLYKYIYSPINITAFVIHSDWLWTIKILLTYLLDRLTKSLFAADEIYFKHKNVIINLILIVIKYNTV